MAAQMESLQSSQQSTAIGTPLYGQTTRTSEPNYPLDGKSYVFTGPSYYVPAERRWLSINDYRTLPIETRRDAILFESENEWRKYRESPGIWSNSSLSDIPAKYPTAHTSVLLPYQRTAWSRGWDGSGFFVPSTNAWIHEQIGPNIPTESLLFYNEEDWMKFKYMAENPVLPNLKKEGKLII
ncbi:hypothetical protein SNE40_023015 [Patella caerulea]|uniref:Uncharacterized protein n=1 Tax=Patella caerulea TaxID=87958 RepID=A0AAN8J425_PATCE